MLKGYRLMQSDGAETKKDTLHDYTLKYNGKQNKQEKNKALTIQQKD